MKRIIYLLFMCSLLQWHAIAFAENIHMDESYRIILNKLPVVLDNGKHTITVTAEWHYNSPIADKDYIDSFQVTAYVRNFLLNYPNKKEFWEIINRKLALFILNKFPQMHSFVVEIAVPDSTFDPYPHISRVLVERK